MSVNPEPLSVIECIAGILSVLFLIWVLKGTRSGSRVLWNDTDGVLGVIRPLTVEVSVAVLFDSIPQGIDLSHNARGVINTMSNRLEDAETERLEFVVCRPLNNSPTRVGFIVERVGLRISGTSRKIGVLTDLVREDALILESAMRSSYPHTPIIKAGLQDMILLKSGGIDTFVRDV
ncbi:MAG: hypothetical protein ACTSV2_06990 [Candidatus Thorarchaeota archaeon]